MATPSPYRGLVPYTEDDSEWFFGREADRELISANLQSARLTVLFGTSGAGKSSVLRAGVVHDLLRESQENLQSYGQPEFAVVYFRNWSGNVTRHVVDAIGDAVGVALGRSVDGWEGASVADACKLACAELGGRLLLIFDQFEEYFLYHAAGHSFEVELARLVAGPDPAVNTLLSLREDSLARLDRFKGRIPRLFGNYLRVKHLDRDAAREAIVRPAHHYLELQPDRRIELSSELVETVLDSVLIGRVRLENTGYGEGPRPKTRVEAPYLQLVMTRLWADAERRVDEAALAGRGSPRLAPVRVTAADLTRLGGAERIVRAHLENVVSGLTEEERQTAAETFRFLVTPSGTKIAYSVRDLAGLTGIGAEALQRVLTALARGELRILRVAEGNAGSDPSPRYEIFHDVLGQAVLEWRHRFCRQRQLQAEVRAVRDKERAQRRRQYRILTYGASAGVLVVTIAYSSWAYTQKAKVEAQLAREKILRQRAEEAWKGSDAANVEAQRRLVKTEASVVELLETSAACKGDAVQLEETHQELLALKSAMSNAQKQVRSARAAQRLADDAAAGTVLGKTLEEPSAAQSIDLAVPKKKD
ncbi:MAG: hypothetical protein JW751_30425 [Polyangiaceae bacterium]|nr:hypothetical protein [Polyangiaceae bacterium]